MLEFELLLFGAALLALVLVPVPFVNKVGNKVNGLLYKFHITSPVPKVINGTISFPLLVGLASLAVAAFHFIGYYNKHIVNFDQRKLLNDIDNGKRFRSERNMYLWACSAAVYLALHSFARLQDSEDATERRQVRNAVNAFGAGGASSAPAPASAAQQQQQQATRNTTTTAAAESTTQRNTTADVLKNKAE